MSAINDRTVWRLTAGEVVEMAKESGLKDEDIDVDRIIEIFSNALPWSDYLEAAIDAYKNEIEEEV